MAAVLKPMEQGRYPALSKEFIESILYLDREAGSFYWIKPSKYHNEKIGTEAGCPRKSGGHGASYWRIKINGRPYLRSRLVFCVVHNGWPDEVIDHINGDTLDDRPQNLRAATILQNAWNHKSFRKNSKLPVGVRRLPSGRFQARISHRHRQIHLGAFDTLAKAVEARSVAEEKLYGRYRRA